MVELNRETIGDQIVAEYGATAVGKTCMSTSFALCSIFGLISERSRRNWS
jgi:hypothetical protein